MYPAQQKKMSTQSVITTQETKMTKTARSENKMMLPPGNPKSRFPGRAVGSSAKGERHLLGRVERKDSERPDVKTWAKRQRGQGNNGSLAASQSPGATIRCPGEGGKG